MFADPLALPAGGGAPKGAGAREDERKKHKAERQMCLLTCVPCLQIKAQQKEEAAREHEREKREAERKGHSGGAGASGNGASASGPGSGGSGGNFRGTAASEAGIQAAASDPSKGSSSARS